MHKYVLSKLYTHMLVQLARKDVQLARKDVQLARKDVQLARKDVILSANRRDGILSRCKH